jgi:hypothetical protein
MVTILLVRDEVALGAHHADAEGGGVLALADAAQVGEQRAGGGDPGRDASEAVSCAPM